ncbi:murinoglobulin-2-like [Pollicipes pollicipes]|uniref:murinoglobulin-2-like n=1 Tax=Pollicipes pollicipes TaxID=41117 RepID=UPI001884B5CB|nr:murinoglobulin-2-like [Pollicipes pollicipes]
MAGGHSPARRYTLEEARRLLWAGRGRSSAVPVTIEFANSERGRKHSFRVHRDLTRSWSTADFECFVVSVPANLQAQYIFVSVGVQGRARSGTQVSKSAKIRVLPNVLVTLVQTDKAKYQPGKTVQIRIISLRHDFTPLDEKIKEVWVTTPDGTRLAQWLDVEIVTGMVQREIHLSEEPPLGQWSIHVKRQKGPTTVQHFDVEEFVPPRFELSVSSPGTVFRDSSVMTIKVCAKYTFGKPLVSAGVLLTVRLSQPKASFGTPTISPNDGTSFTKDAAVGTVRTPVSRRITRTFGTAITTRTRLDDLHDGPTRVMTAEKARRNLSARSSRITRSAAPGGLLSVQRRSTRRKRAITVGPNEYADKTGDDGCATINVVLSQIGSGSGGHFNRYDKKYFVSVNVTEAGTDISQAEGIVVPVRESKLIQVISSKSPQFFKPTLDFYGTVRFERPDDSPLVKERVEICYSTYFYEDSSLKSSASSLPFLMKSPRTAYRAERCTTYTTDGTGRINYVVPAQSASISSLSFKGRLLGRDQRFALPSVRAWYSPSDSFLLADVRQLLGGGTCGRTVGVPIHSSRNLRDVPLQYMIMARGDVVENGVITGGHLRLTVRSAMAPSFKLLVFAVTADGEVVADSRLVETDKCLPNEVSVSWKEAQVRPGRTGVLHISASPGSLCGISTVDRSAELLGTSNTVTPQKVFSQVQQLIIQKSESPRLTRSSGYCPPSRRPSEDEVSVVPTCPGYEDVSGGRREMGTMTIKVTEIYYIPDDREDALAAFDMAGFLAVSNLALQTRPCIERRHKVTRQRRCWKRYRNIQSTSLPQVGTAASSAGGSRNVVSAEGSNTADSSTSFAVPSVRATSDRTSTTNGISGGSQTANGRAGARSNRGVSQTADGGAGARINRGGSHTANGAVARTNRDVEIRRKTLRNGQAKRTGDKSPGVEEILKETVLEPEVRRYFPETFMFELEVVGSSGRQSLSRTLPDTITSWTSSAVCSHPKVGLGISPTASIKAFKPFFAEINLPYSVKRGELLQLKVSVFNFLSSELSVILVLNETPDLILEKSGAGARRALCVQPSKPTVSTFPLLFTSLGQVDVQVSVEAAGNACGGPNSIGVQSDVLVRQMLVKPEGFPQEETLSERICPDKGVATHVFNLATSPRIVPGSARAVFSLYGDPLAQAITQVSGLESLVRVPHGCGEQNMVLLVPNILVRQYLEATNQLSQELKKKTTDNMRTGYQRQLRYRHRDGSYSAFGERSGRSQGSLWLTVYVIKSFTAAARFVPIDQRDLAVSRRWVEQQQRDDGCFNTVGWLCNKAMSGGVGGGDRLALTAYTLLALVETGASGDIVRRAAACLRRGTPRGIYAEALVAQALAVANEKTAAAELLPALLKRALREKAALHWRTERGRLAGGAALDVETTAYMTMTLLRLGGHAADSLATVTWLDRQRNGRGGFVSTQDTVVALAALVAAETEASRRLKAAALEVTVRVGARQTPRRFTVTPENRLLHQQLELRPLQLPVSLAVSVSGLGCVVAQTTMRYSLQETKAKQAFRLQHKIRPLKRNSCQSYVVELCASYLEADAASNMAIIEMEMPSGYLIVDHVLQQLERSGVVQRWEFRNAVLSLYFDQLVKKEVCFDVQIWRDSVVERLKPATIAVYDYYTTEYRVETDYELPVCKF